MTVITKKTRLKNSHYFHMKICFENGLSQDRFFSDVHISIYKGIPFIKCLIIRKHKCSFSEYHLLFVEMSKANLLKNQDKIMNNTLFELTSDAK